MITKIDSLCLSQPRTVRFAIADIQGAAMPDDCLHRMQRWPDDCVDLVFCSPPYENARRYDMDFKLRGDEWVDWAVERYLECVRVCRGLVAWVVEGRTSKFQWSATPALMMAKLHHAGVKLRKPPIYSRVGIPGSGGPDWWRNDYEFIVCSSKGKLPWSDNTATGHPPKFPPGGAMSNRTTDGKRRNKTTGTRLERPRPMPAKANPGNIIRCHGGGGHMGSKLAHENEAPFAEPLADAFVRSFCPPGGLVLDPFCGSGTTLAVAMSNNRNAVGIDVRESQVNLTAKRVMEAMENG